MDSTAHTPPAEDATWRSHLFSYSHSNHYPDCWSRSDERLWGVSLLSGLRLGALKLTAQRVATRSVHSDPSDERGCLQTALADLPLGFAAEAVFYVKH
ncbi:hypothetical protein THUN1379_24450 [Paludibacterium sp. THUN1379]|nr:hypothetical protein THUN1379_24450 [Paludibacterium sp. THUN1379]